MHRRDVCIFALTRAAAGADLTFAALLPSYSAEPPVITGSLIVLAVLAYLGRSLVMLASTGGMAIAIWLAQSGSLSRQFIAVLVGGVGASLAAEGVHLIHHALLGDQPGHGGFWVSAVLVGLIDAAAMLPALLWVRRKQRSAPPSPVTGSDVG